MSKPPVMVSSTTLYSPHTVMDIPMLCCASWTKKRSTPTVHMVVSIFYTGLAGKLISHHLYWNEWYLSHTSMYTCHEKLGPPKMVPPGPNISKYLNPPEHLKYGDPPLKLLFPPGPYISKCMDPLCLYISKCMDPLSPCFSYYNMVAPLQLKGCYFVITINRMVNNQQQIPTTISML